MRSISLCQTGGSVAVVGAFAMSEIGARFLDRCPGCALAWYLNLEVFRPFEAARNGTSALRYLYGSASLGIAGVVMAVAVAAHVRRWRFVVAALANLSFLVTLFLAQAWFGNASRSRTASLGAAGGGVTPDNLLVNTMIGVSLVAAALGHATLLRDIMRRSAATGASVPA